MWHFCTRFLFHVEILHASSLPLVRLQEAKGPLLPLRFLLLPQHRYAALSLATVRHQRHVSHAVHHIPRDLAGGRNFVEELLGASFRGQDDLSLPAHISLFDDMGPSMVRRKRVRRLLVVILI